MKNKLLAAILIGALLTAINTLAFCQVTAGPSDITTAPPTTASAVGKIICGGQAISITAIDSGATAFTWYKTSTTQVAGTAHGQLYRKPGERQAIITIW